MKYTSFTFSFWHMQMKKFLVWLQYGKADSSMLKCEKWQRFLKERKKKKNPSEYWIERMVWTEGADLISIDFIIFLSYLTKKIPPLQNITTLNRKRPNFVFLWHMIKCKIMAFSTAFWFSVSLGKKCHAHLISILMFQHIPVCESVSGHEFRFLHDDHTSYSA